MILLDERKRARRLKPSTRPVILARPGRYGSFIKSDCELKLYLPQRPRPQPYCTIRIPRLHRQYRHNG